MPVVELDESFLSQAVAERPVERTTCFFDEALKGFMLEMRPSGRGTFYLRYRDAARRVRLERIGRLGEIPVTEARYQAEQLKAMVARGETPVLVRSSHENPPRFSDFVTQRYIPYIKRNKRSWATDVSLLNRHLLPLFGDRPLDDIGRGEIVAMHDHARQAGYAAGTCNRLLVLMRYIFNLAIRWQQMPVGTNPCADIDKLEEDAPEVHYLTPHEVARLFDELDQSRSPQLANIVRMLLYTGARKREIMDARWEAIDYDRRVLQLRPRGGSRPREVTLSDAAMALIRKQPRTPDNPYIFPNPSTGKPLVSLFAGWDAVRQRAGLPRVRLHDLRHSFAAFLIESGHSLREVQALLGHQTPRMTMRYAEVAPERLLEAANDVAKRIRGQDRTGHQV